MKRFALFCIIALCATASFAIPAKPGLRAIQQPDGSTLMVQLIGDEYFHYHATSDGLPIMQNESGAYVYANMLNDMFVATDVVAHDPSMRNAEELHIISQLQPVKMPESAKQLMQNSNERRAARAQERRNAIGQPGQTIGKHRGLIILVDFPDTRMSHTREEFDAMMNQKDYNLNGSIGSLSDYFYDQSYGQLEINFDVVGPFTASKSIKYYGENSLTYKDQHVGEFITEAVNMAHEAGTDFSKYDWTGDGNVDQVFVIYAGYAESSGAPDYTIWPREGTLESYSTFDNEYSGPISLDGVTVNKFACSSELKGTEGNDMCGIGTAAHEFSHCLGLPDFYDLTTQHKGAGMGVWSIMDYGDYNHDGYVPCAYTSYERMFCGWLKPVELTEDTCIENMRPITEAPEAYIIYNKANRNEYYLLENHQQSHNSDKYHAWDSGAYGNGMLVLHVDYNQWRWRINSVNADAKFQGMTIIPANNIFEYKQGTKEIFAGDTYPGTTGTTALTNISVPKAELNTPNSDGTKLMNAPITNITEANGGISFNFGSKILTDIPVLGEPSNVDSTSFVASWKDVDYALSYTLEVTDLLPPPVYEPVMTTLFEMDFTKMEPFASATEEGTEDIGGKLKEYLNSDWRGDKIFMASKSLKIGTTGGLYTSTFRKPYDGKLTLEVGFSGDDASSDYWLVLLYDSENNYFDYAKINFDTKQQIITFENIDTDFYFYSSSSQPVNIFYLSAQALMTPPYNKVETYESIEANSLLLTDLRPNGHYSYRVKANTLYGYTEWSEPKEVWLSGPTSPTSITDVQSSPVRSSIIVFDKQNRRIIIRRNGKWYDLLGKNIE